VRVFGVEDDEGAAAELGGGAAHGDEVLQAREDAARVGGGVSALRVELGGVVRGSD
jgi:hypothetical protein